MILTLSENRLSNLIRQLEGITDTHDELHVRFDHYCSRLFVHVNDVFGLRMVGMVSNAGTVAAFKFDISAIGRNWQGDWDWEKLMGGLQLLNPVAITVESIDMEWICTGLIATTMADNWELYAHTLQRLSVNQLQSAIETACREIAWKTPVNASPIPDNDLMREFNFRAQLERAGDADSLRLLNEINRQDAVDTYQRVEADAYKTQEDAAFKARWGIDRD